MTGWPGVMSLPMPSASALCIGGKSWHSSAHGRFSVVRLHELSRLGGVTTNVYRSAWLSRLGGLIGLSFLRLGKSEGERDDTRDEH